MLIIPVRSEKETSRYPHVTIGLIVINLVVWMLTNHSVSTEYKQIEAVHKRLLQIEIEYFHAVVGEDPALVQNPVSGQIHQFFMDNDVIPKHSEEYREWLVLYHEFMNLKENTFFHRWGFIPARLNLFKLLISLFLHGSFFHVFGNMLYLWIVGCNMEDDWGWPRFLGLYLLSGIAAGLSHCIFDPNMTLPCIGASGAVAGVMGAFMIQHFKTRIRFAYFFILIFRPIWGTFRIMAGAVLPFWFLMELLYAQSGIQTGTAHWAHVGGFIFGMAAVIITKYLTVKEPHAAEKVPADRTAPACAASTPGSGETCLTPIESFPEDASSVSKLNEIISMEPNNVDVRLKLARITLDSGHQRSAAVSFNRVMDTLFGMEEEHRALAIFDEMKRNNLLRGLSSANLFRSAQLLEKAGKYTSAVKTFGSYIKWYPEGIMRAQALIRAYTILKDHIRNASLADRALNFLKAEYPDHPGLPN